MVDASKLTREQFEAEIAPVCDAFVQRAQPAIRRAADDLYFQFLSDAQSYLTENAQWNLGQIITDRENLAARVIELEAEIARLNRLAASLVPMGLDEMFAESERGE